VLHPEPHPLAGQTVKAVLHTYDDVLYGKVGGAGHLVHVSELVQP
jgi:hypothetical protein